MGGHPRLVRGAHCLSGPAEPFDEPDVERGGEPEIVDGDAFVMTVNQTVVERLPLQCRPGEDSVGRIVGIRPASVAPVISMGIRCVAGSISAAVVASTSRTGKKVTLRAH